MNDEERYDAFAVPGRESTKFPVDNSPTERNAPKAQF